MSCLIQKSESVAIIASFISRLLTNGFNSFGFSASNDVFMAFRDCQGRGFYSDRMIYEKLYEANFKAYNERYKNLPAERMLSWEDYKETKEYEFHAIDIWKHREINIDGTEIPQEWHYKLLKTIQFLEYQLVDNATEENLVYKALVSLDATLAMFIITNSEAYKKIEWE